MKDKKQIKINKQEWRYIDNALNNVKEYTSEIDNLRGDLRERWKNE